MLSFRKFCHEVFMCFMALLLRLHELSAEMTVARTCGHGGPPGAVRNQIASGDM
jgi:hypothetical protein